MGIKNLTTYIVQIIKEDRERRRNNATHYLNYNRPLCVVIDGNNLRKRLYYAILQRYGVFLSSSQIRGFIQQYFLDIKASGIEVKYICFDSIKEINKLKTYIKRENRKLEVRKRLYADVETHDLDGYHLDPLFFRIFFEECVNVVGEDGIFPTGRDADK